MSEAVRVIYVDDDPNSLELRSSLLERYGDFEVVTETDPSAALERLTAGEQVDCLLSDLEMPAMDGIEFLQAVREHDPDLPFIMFTARDTDKAVEAALDHGATDFIPKSTASLSYRLVARRIEQAVELAGGDAAADDIRESTGGLAASIESALNDDPVDDPDESDEDDLEVESCPVPGCSFENKSETGLVAHFADRTEGDGIDARLHRALQRQALRSPASRSRRVDTDRQSRDRRIPETPSRRRRRRSDRVDAPRQSMDRGGAIGLEHREYREARTGGRVEDRPRRERFPPHESAVVPPRLTAEDIDAIARSLSEYLRGEDHDDGSRERNRAHDPQEEVQTGTPQAALDIDPPAERPEPDQRTERDPDPRSSFDLSFDLDRWERPSDEADPEETELDEEGVPAIEAKPGDTILVGCDTQDDTRDELCHRAIEAGPDADRDLILIRYRAIDDDHLERIAEKANRVTLIAVGHEQAIPDEFAETVDVRTIPKVSDLRRLGILVTRTIEEWRDDDTELRVCIDSLNVVLRYADAEKLFRFLHLLLGKIESVDGITHSHIDPSSETERELNMLETLFDTVLTSEGKRDSLIH